MKWTTLILIGLPLCFSSCRTIGDIRNALSLPQPTKAVYYAGVADMKLYPAPNTKGPSAVHLPLNEAVILLETQHTWAFVKVAKTGSTGWVEKTYLERKPLALKQSSKVKTATPEGQGVEDGACEKSQGKTQKGVLDILEPDSAIAAPPCEGKPARPETRPDVFDAF